MSDKKLIRVLLLSVLMLTLANAISGCHKKVNSSNPIVIQAADLNNAESIVHAIAIGLKSADTVIDTVQTSDPEYYAAAGPKLAALARLNEAANLCITDAVKHPQSPHCNWKDAVVAIANAAPQNMSTLTAFGFKNPATQKKVTNGLKLLIDGLNLAIQFKNLGGQ